MKKIDVFLQGAVIFLVMLCLPTVSSGKKSSEDVKALVRGNTEFALEIYSKLKKEKGNIFFSPYSISSAMGMVYAGARGETEKQMAKTLRFSLNQQDIHPAFAHIFASMNAEVNKIQKSEDNQIFPIKLYKKLFASKSGDIGLFLANSLWVQQEYKLLGEYLALTEKYYGASVTPVDYIHATEKASELINQWVSDKTGNKINDILQPGTLDSLTRLVLVNAICFKGKWDKPFEKRWTRDEPFYLSASKSVKVPMMRLDASFECVDTDDGLQILRIPYQGYGFSIIVLLPKKIDGLGEIESRLSAENLDEWIQLLDVYHGSVSVYLPRFRMTSSFGLNTVLQQMGMSDAFSMKKADFSGMNGKNCTGVNPDCLYISAVIHKAYVDVDEEGTEAAAATTGKMAKTSAPNLPKVPTIFRADHPFLFLIQEHQSGSILFMGRVTDPSKTGE
jgi:serpin B